MKHLNKLVIATTLALINAGCVSDIVSIQIQNVVAGGVGADCTVTDGDTQKSSGSIDVAYMSEVAPAYFLALRVISNLNTEELAAAGEPVNPTSRNDFYVTKVLISYEGAFSLEDEMDVSGRVDAGGELLMGMNVLSPRAFAEMQRKATEEPKSVILKIKLQGQFAHGSELTTGEFQFPLYFYESADGAPECTPGQVIVPAVAEAIPPCGNWGQDGYRYLCQDPEASAQ